LKLKQKISSDVVVTTAVKLSRTLRGIVFIPLISQLLGVDAYGAYVQLVAITALLALVSEMGLHGALVKYAQEDDTDQTDLFYSLVTFALASGLLVALLLWSFAPTVSRLTLDTGRYVSVFQVGAFLSPLRIHANMSRNYFRSEMRVKLSSILDGVKVYASVGTVLVALVVYGTGLVGVVYALLLVEGLFSVAIQYLVSRKIGYTVPTFNELSRSLAYSIPLTGATIASNISSRADRLLIGFYLGATAVGVYSIAYAVANFLATYVQPVTVSFFPEFSRLLEGGRTDDVAEYVEAGVRYFLILAVPSAAGLYLVGPELVRLLSDQSVATASVRLLPLLAAGVLFRGLEQLYGVVLVALGETTTVSLVRGGAAAVNTVLNIALIPLLGIIGAALATLASYLLVAAAMYRFANDRVGAGFDILEVGRVVCSAAIMTGVVFVVAPDSIVPAVVIGVLTYFPTLVALGGLRVSEVSQFIPG
jgi:O-antigen/teichoic acid export membrane protein